MKLFKKKDPIYDLDMLSEYIVGKCCSEGNPITVTRLNEILYFIQVAFINEGLTAFAEDFEALENGPVIPYISQKYQRFHEDEITAGRSKTPKDTYVVDIIIDEWADAEEWKSYNEISRKGSAYSLTYLAGIGNGKIIKKETISFSGF